jgi:hypothetical protein
MNHTALDLLLAAGCATAALAVGALGGVGLLVWLAGCRVTYETEARHKAKLLSPPR